MHQFLPLLHRLADASGSIIRQYYRQVAFDDKADNTPVTRADREAEQVILTLLAQTRPQDGVWGEEYGASHMDAEWAWVIDPIDGTKAFIRGMPMFATLIALLHHQVPVLGVIDQPILQERWIGGVGVPTTLNGAPVQTRRCPDLAAAIVNATSPAMFSGENAAAGEKYHALEQRCNHALWGGDAYAYAMLASGFIDVQVDTSMKLHDYAALVPIIEAAGGRITDWQGQDLGLHSDGRILAVGDPGLLEPCLALLG